jgi:YHS domain-containing protein
MFVTMAASALVIDALFSGAGLVPASRPTRGAVFGSVAFDYKLILDAIALLTFAALFAMTARRGVRDPVCGMRVERAKAVTATHDGETIHFCSPHCRDAYASSRAH